jgi:predicted metal-binding protein
LTGLIELIGCETCGSGERESHGRSRGERLLEQLRELQQSEHPQLEARISSVRCLWACSRSCALHVRSAGRPGYILCELDASGETARALLAWSELYAESSDGAVPYKRWPEKLRGHFLCRVPAQLPATAASEPNPER